jgi:GNAT superfamily N-acetyltransferase
MVVRKLAVSETQTFLAFLTEAQEWLKAKGIDQWTYPFSEDAILDSVVRGEVFVMIKTGKIKACVSLFPRKDDYWGDVKGAALYLHRLIVPRSQTGRGFGEQLLKWAEDYTRDQGIPNLRLDCISSNEKLRDYYQQRGFDFKGEGKDKTACYALFEKRLL